MCATGSLRVRARLQAVERQLQAHLEQQEQHAQLAQLLQLLCVAEQPAQRARTSPEPLSCRMHAGSPLTPVLLLLPHLP